MRCIALSAIQLGATPIDLFRGETYGALSVKRSWLFTTVSYLSLQMYRSKAAPPPPPSLLSYPTVRQFVFFANAISAAKDASQITSSQWKGAVGLGRENKHNTKG